MTKDDVKRIAIQMVQEEGLANLSRSELSKRAGIKDGSFLHVVGCSFSDLVAELQAEHVIGPSNPVNKTRTNPALRKEAILGAAMDLSRAKGYRRVTREEVARRANVSAGLVSRYFGTMVQLQRDIIRKAIKDEELEIVAQGLAANDKHALKAPAELRTRAAHKLARI